jgi:CO/xanthine dehydrogenase FAD-binding subunit
MKPFAYEAPESVAAAVALLAEKGRRARPLAGGTDLLPQLRQGRWDLDFVVDIKRIPELTRIEFDAGMGLTVGSAVTCAEFCENPDVQALYPGLVDAASIIGGAAIQGRATLGGNLCNAAPSGDSIAAMIVHGAEVIVAGPGGRRTLPVAEFCTAPGATVLALGELVVALRVPAPQPHTGAHYVRFIPRGEMDIAVVGAGAWVALSAGQQRITVARIALSAVAPTSLFVEIAGTYLVGKAPTEAAFAEAAALAQGAASPIEDTRGTVAQRRHLVGVLVKRALRGAVERASAPITVGLVGKGA